MEAIKTQVVVIGGGVAGYSTAFRCADLGLQVVMVEREKVLGGVCLNMGCIPSKALLHIAKIINDSQVVASQGVNFGTPKIDLMKMRVWKDRVIQQLNGGLSSMANLRKVKLIQGEGEFVSDHQLKVFTAKEELLINFDYAVIANGSSPIELPFLPEDPRIWNSDDALALPEIPNRLLIIGGGIIGLEMATVYQALGSMVEIVEMGEQLIPNADQDIVKVYQNIAENKFKLSLNTQVTQVDPEEDELVVSFNSPDGEEIRYFDVVLVAVGRKPNGKLINASKARVVVDEQGFIPTDKQQRTNVGNIFAVGDVTGQPMLAHKGSHAGKVAGEVIAGEISFFAPKVIPSIAYTQPEVAWVGKTERECQQEGINYQVAKFPWTASGRALASSCGDGLTKLIFDPASGRIIGGAVVGENAGELLGEITLALEMGSNAEDIALTIHAHPTLHETIGLTAEIFTGTVTDYPNSKAKKV